MSQLAGAIKMRAQERGGKIEPPTALSHARRIQREASLIANEKALFRDVGWIGDHVHRDIELLVSRIVELTEEIQAKLGMRFIAVSSNRWCILRDERVSMSIYWRQAISNSVSEEAEILAMELNGPVFMPGEGMITVHRPRELRRHRFTPKLSPSGDLSWMERGNKSELLSIEDLAQRIVTLFVDLLHRANKGQVDLMHL